MMRRRSGPAIVALLLAAVTVANCDDEKPSGTVEAPPPRPSPAADAAPPASGTPNPAVNPR